MKELKALLESELLNEETKAALREAVKTYKANAINEAKKELEVEYASKLVAKTQEMAELLPKMIEEAVNEEVGCLKSDIENFKQLEIRYAAKLEEFKEDYAIKMGGKLQELVEGTLKDELVELKDDLMEVKKVRLGKRVFEALAQEMAEFGLTPDVAELKTALEDATKNLEESVQEINTLKREKMMNSLLSKLTGSKREVMKSILENVDTDKLESRFEESIEQVLEGPKSKLENDKKLVVESEETDAEREIFELKILSGQINN